MDSEAVGRAYLYDMIYFLKVPIWIEPDTDEDSIDKLIKPSQPYKRIAMIPFDFIMYMHEGEDRKTTEIVLEDGDILVAAEKYDIIFGLWEKWYSAQRQAFITYMPRSN